MLEIKQLNSGDITVVLVKLPDEMDITGTLNRYRIYLFDLERDDDGGMTIHEWLGSTDTRKEKETETEDLRQRLIGMITGIDPWRSAFKGGRHLKPKKNKIKQEIEKLFHVSEKE